MNNIEIRSPPAAAVSSFPPVAAGDDAGAAVPLSAAPASSLSNALSVRDNLRAKADAVRAAIEALAFSAHTGNEAVEKKLSALNNKRLVLIADEEMISVAHIEASRKVDDAQRMEALAIALDCRAERKALAETRGRSIAG